MGSILDKSINSVKTIIIGESGDGKTGALMSLIAAGYNVRILDTDNGNLTLKGLLHPNYSYLDYIKSKGIDLDQTTSFIPISTEMGMRTITHKFGNQTHTETILAPKNARAWGRIISQLENWKDGEKSYGHISTWDNNCVLVFDSFTTISRQAYYYNQEQNSRLGASETGYSHGLDVGGAQSQLRRLLEMIYGDDIKCNIVFICHINKIDDSQGYTQTPEARKLRNPDAIVEVKGYPQSVGLALSKRVGIYFNDSFITRRTGEGRNVQRKLCTTPTTIDGVTVAAKTSSFLRPEYDISTGLAEIFAAHRGLPEPLELIESCGKKRSLPKEAAEGGRGGIPASISLQSKPSIRPIPAK